MSWLIALNCGSSSVKAALYRKGEPDRPIHRTHIARADRSAIEGALHAMEAALPPEGRGAVACIGHRVVHGGVEFHEPVAVSPDVFKKLDALSPLAPLHQPIDLLGIQIARQMFPRAQHVACFDTAFHRDHPFVYDTYGLPRRFFKEGVRRYGFHGLSYEYIVARAAEIYPQLSASRMLVAHLGSGASICAIRNGKSVACTMGFSALGGLVMGTRCGDLDPGVILYLMRQHGLGVEEVSRLLYEESGLKGLSGISSDMRELLSSDRMEAKEAVDYFVSRCCYELAGLASTLGGVDALIFTGGIGEHSAQIRERICEAMGWLGIAINSSRNLAQETELSAVGSAVLVIRLATDEEATIARQAFACIDRQGLSRL